MAQETKILIEWNDKEFEKAQKLDMTSRMALACLEIEKMVKLSFGDSGIRGATKSERESNRSSAGEPPHVQTGRLRASISSNWSYSGIQEGKTGSWQKQPKESEYWDGPVGEGVGSPGGAYPVISGVVGSNVKYAPALELGSSKMDARPFLRPALESSKSAIKRIFGVK